MSDNLQLDPKLTGKAMALADQYEQAAFLNEFGRVLEAVCRRNLGMDSQCCWIADGLDGNGRNLIEQLHGAIEAWREAEQTRKTA